MGLKDLKSNLDLVQGATNPVGEMDNLNPPGFDQGPSSTLQPDSLANLPTTSPHQDLDGLPSVNYNRLAGTSDSPFDSNDHLVDLLTKDVTSNNTNEIYQPTPTTLTPTDLDGLPGNQFDNGANSTLHQDSLTQQYAYQHGLAQETVGPIPGPAGVPVPQDLDGLEGPGFDLGPNSTLQVDLLKIEKQKSIYQDFNGEDGGQGYFHDIDKPTKGQGKKLNGVDLHEALLTDSYQYQHGKMAGVDNPITIGPSPGASGNSEYQDLDGVDGGQGYFHGVSSPGAGQGKQLGGEDLHVSLLSNGYNYTHGDTNASILENTQGGTHDLDGELPSNGEYISNLPD